MLLSSLARTCARALLGCAALLLATGAAAQTERLRVRLDWTPWGVHAPFHLAQQRGWFAAAGLDVQLEDGNGSVTTVQIVGSGDQFDLGHASLAPMMIARDKGLPVKAVAVFARLSDVGLLVPRDSGIRGPKDLKGKKVAYTAGSLEAPFVDAFLAAGGLKRADVELVNVDAAGKAATYAAGRTDVAFSTIPFFLPVVSATRPSDGIRFSDYNLNMPSFGLFATEAKIAARREAIARFASVVAAAWQYILDGHQDEAVEAILAQRPQARLDRAVLRGQIDALAGFVRPAAAQAQPIGVPAPAEWSAAMTTLSAAGLVRAAGNPADFFVAGLVRPVSLAREAAR